MWSCMSSALQVSPAVSMHVIIIHVSRARPSSTDKNCKGNWFVIPVRRRSYVDLCGMGWERVSQSSSYAGWTTHYPSILPLRMHWRTYSTTIKEEGGSGGGGKVANDSILWVYIFTGSNSALFFVLLSAQVPSHPQFEYLSICHLSICGRDSNGYCG